MAKSRTHALADATDPGPCRGVCTIRVGIFDDHDLMREALTRVLRGASVFEVVAAGSSAHEAVDAAQEFLPDILLLDVSMPGGGINAAQTVFCHAPFVKSVMLSSNDDADVVSDALSAGAYAFLAKGLPAQELTAALCQIHRGWSGISPGLAEQLIASRGFGAPWSSAPELSSIDLEEREEQILRRLSQGLTEAEIAEGIGLSETAVGAFSTNILLKLHRQRLTDKLISAQE